MWREHPDVCRQVQHKVKDAASSNINKYEKKEVFSFFSLFSIWLSLPLQYEKNRLTVGAFAGDTLWKGPNGYIDAEPSAQI